FAKQRDFERGKSFLARARRHIRQRFGVAAQRNRHFVGQIQAVRQTRFQQRAHVTPHLFGLHGANHSGNVERGHQAHGADGKLRALDDAVIGRMLSSRLPPPRSTMQRGCAPGPMAARAATRPRRDSSLALTTSRRMPVVCLTRCTKVCRFCASRVALVATARYLVTPNSSIISRRWRKALTPLFNSSSLKRWRTKTPSPSRSG